MATLASITIDKDQLVGEERALLLGAFTPEFEAQVKASLKDACDDVLRRVKALEGISRKVLWDAIADLSESAPTNDLYVSFQRLLLLQSHVTYWYDKKDLPARGEPPRRRYEDAVALRDRALAPFATDLDDAIANDEITFTSDRTAVPAPVVWIA